MKRIVLLLVVISTAISVNAQRVALHSSTGTQYFWGATGLVSAYGASNVGDTIYLPGGSFTPPASFEKPLFVFGAGHYVDSTLVTGKTFINGDVILKENADGFYMEGLEVNGKISFTYNASVNDVVIRRCKINSNVEVLGNLTNPSHNISLIGNVIIGTINLSNAQLVLVSNNIIQTGITSTNENYISNNIFLYRLGSGSYENFRGNNNHILNNIFVTHGSYGITSSGYSGNDFQNNLIAHNSPGYGGSASVINSYTGIDQSAIFISQTGTSFTYAHDYHLQNPDTYLGTDGTQVGIYGGTFPYKEGAVPSNPHFQIKNIAPTTDASGDLQIQIQVEAQEN
ncbi:MAG: hypothetical protein PHW82_15035 [Bacteroidales bacterium]|nr:hypothetical protein [Bacteroidales bacterium]